MTPSGSLRSQLAERKPLPPSPPGSRALETGETVRCMHTSERARGVTIDTGDAVASFPYSHYLYALLAPENSLTIRFATHCAVVTGRNLKLLLEELTGQRLDLLRALPDCTQGPVEKNTVRIEHIEIIEVRVAPNKLSS